MHFKLTIDLSISRFLIFLSALFLLAGCGYKPGGRVTDSGITPDIIPDYSGLVIPVNIAPLNFRIQNEGNAYYAEISSEANRMIRVRSSDGQIRIPVKQWHDLLSDGNSGTVNFDIYIRDGDGEWKKFNRITNKVSPFAIDNYLTYRLLYPGYESWRELSIEQRDLQSFTQKTVINNLVAEENCVNCHSYNKGNDSNFMFHMRGSIGGTYFYKGGEITKINLKTPEMKNGAVYPRWHPSGKFVAFSSNKVVQQFHSSNNKKVEVSDLESCLVLYDTERNEMLSAGFEEQEKFMDTYPEWSPDGKYIYFCRTGQIGEVYDYSAIRYDLYRASFDASGRKFGNPELVFEASARDKSVSFPRISPDGRYLVMTMQDYGCFPIWHKETDLFILNTDSLTVRKMELNSNQTDSYHSWSANGRWMVFSSKRTDGLTARPYIAFIDENGCASKPFVLPQEDPDFYYRFLKTYNIPELSDTRISINPGLIRRISRTDPVQAGWAD